MSTDNLMRYILPVAASGAGSYFGSRANSKAAGEAAQYQQNAMDKIASTANNMYNQTRSDLTPYQDVFRNASGQLNQAITSPNNYAQNYISRLENNNNMYAPGALNLTHKVADNIQNPELQNKVNFNLESDPLYAAQKQEIMRQINARNAAMGKFNSSDADNAVTRNIAGLMTDAYGRQLGDLERANQNALAMYGVDVDRWNRGYTNANLNNQAELSEYGWDVDRYNRNQQNILNQYGIADSADKNAYARLLDAANIGLRSTEDIAGAGTNLVNTLGNAYSSAADAQAQAALAQGMSNAQLAGALGNIPANYQSLKTMGGLVDAFTGGGSNAATAAGGLGAAGLGANAAFGGGAITSGAGSLASGVGAPVSGAALTAASGGGVGATGGAGAAAGGLGAATNALAGSGGMMGAGGGTLGTAGTAAGMSGLGMAAGLLPFAAMGGFIGYKAMQQGQQTGTNARMALEAAERGEKTWTHPKTGYKLDLTDPGVLNNLREQYIQQAQWGTSSPNKQRLYGYTDPNSMRYTNAENVDVSNMSLDDLVKVVNNWSKSPAQNLYNSGAAAH